MTAGRPVFVDIDTQVDFIEPSGRLYVAGAAEILPQLQELFNCALRARVPVLSTVDAHTPDDPEFQNWPPHCVIGTPGQRMIPETVMARSITLAPDAPVPAEWEWLWAHYDQIVFPKPTLDAFDNPHFGEAVEHLADRTFVVFGVATDYCVNLAARGLLERGCRVMLVRDAVRAVAPDSGQRTCEELTAQGASWTTTAQVVGAV